MDEQLTVGQLREAIRKLPDHMIVVTRNTQRSSALADTQKCGVEIDFEQTEEQVLVIDTSL